MYEGPENSGVVIKFVKEQGILVSFADIQASKCQDSTILYWGDRKGALT